MNHGPDPKVAAECPGGDWGSSSCAGSTGAGEHWAKGQNPLKCKICQCLTSNCLGFFICELIFHSHFSPSMLQFLSTVNLSLFLGFIISFNILCYLITLQSSPVIHCPWISQMIWTLTAMEVVEIQYQLFCSNKNIIGRLMLVPDTEATGGSCKFKNRRKLF